jgi:hypothetical protein
MFHAPANTASSVEPAARAEFASRRQPRATNSAQEEGFASILDRAGAQRADALRQLRQIEEPAVDGPALQSGEATSQGVANEPYRKSEPTEPKVQPSKPQRRAAREGDDAGAGDGDVAQSIALLLRRRPPPAAMASRRRMARSPPKSFPESRFRLRPSRNPR